MLRKVSFALALVASTFIARAANAYNSGRMINADVSGTFYRFSLSQSETETLTFTTSNLSLGSDTVIHVQDVYDPQGGYIAGNDDHIGFASEVVVPPVGYWRYLIVIVRSYSQSSQGTCDVTSTSSLYGSTTYSSISFGGAKTTIGSLQQGAHVTTAEIQGGAQDTILLTVMQNDPAHAVAYDDDDGVGFMSFVHNNEACPSCEVILANYSEPGSSNTSLVWDDDADWSDYDNDGLGATLEGLICQGTVCADPWNADSDQDGLLDGAEVLGTEVAYVPVKLPAWGADPLQKDLFWELDWKKCNSVVPGVCPQGLDSGKMGAGILADADFQAQRIDPMKALLAETAIRIHLDVGRPNTNPSTWTEWGAWGGATRLEVPAPPDPDPFDACDTNGSSYERAYMFHYGLGWSPDNAILGWTCGVPAPSFNAMVNDPREVVHETAHGLGLQHGGRAWAGAINYKPNYISMMNYQYYGSGFSHGDFPTDGRVLNPTAVKENPGLGSTASTDVLNSLRDTWCPVTPYSSGKCVKICNAGTPECDSINGDPGVPGLPIGAVDWNRDGVYESQGVTVKGAVNEYFFSRSARTTFQPTWNGGFGVLTDPALTWVSVGGAVGDQLWIFGRDDSSRLVWARTPRTTLDSGCNAFTSFYDESTWNCARFGNSSNPPDMNGMTTVVPGSNSISLAPGAAEYNAQILVVFNRVNETLKAMLITINSTDGSVSYGADMSVPGGYAAAGDITALKTASGEVTVWAPVNTPQRKLMEWKYNGSWSSGVIQKWSEDSTDINPIYGIGATRGYQDNSPTEQTYGAIATNPAGFVEFARKNAGTNTWSKVTFTCTQGSGPPNFGCGASNTASSWAGTGGPGLPPNGTQPMATGRPALAYQRKAGQPNYVGRFYMAFRQGASCVPPFGTPQNWESPACEARLIMTEGNLAATVGSPPAPPTSRRLTWITPVQSIYQPNTESAVVNGISLVDDLTRDTNLRAAFHVAGGPNHGVFEPLADGIINVNLSDFDDYAYLTGGLRAGLCLEGGTWPRPCLLTSLP
jgi:hypothetical protein